MLKGFFLLSFKCGQNDQKYFPSHLFDRIPKSETIATVKKLQRQEIFDSVRNTERSMWKPLGKC